ncbi:sensor histidine kinase [Paenibacillus sabinae]|uniref:histidine kinase n=1 Tax=Paenibacillus sabinae T27 TaxID=1268072 RepID=X4ZST2_9BACL|nr:HAMP domain-containing sensor histidine kinase [Paenibacillus sabinae]AHV95468.1 membrane-associated sensory histidine kinase [Paenibacillus sabinae T27]
MIPGWSAIRRRLHPPRSLRGRLLAISLLILSGLLLLIGVLQYVIMRNFLYTNRAEAMHSQIQSVPRELIFELARSRQESGGALFPSSGSGGAESGGFAGEASAEAPEGGAGQSSAWATGASSGQGGDGAASGSLELDGGGTTNGSPGLNGNEWTGASPGSAAGSDRHTPGRRPLLLDARTTLALFSPDGAFTDLQAETLADSPAPRMEDEEYELLLQHPAGRDADYYRILTSEDGTEHLAVFMTIGPPSHPLGVLQMTADTAPLRDVIMRQLLTYAALSAAALAGGLLLYLPALRKALVPLSNMRKTAQIIDAGNLDVRFASAQGQTEIDQLSSSFNGMLERLESSFRSEREAKEQMRRFAADASHELRTPLTSIHGFLEVLLRGAAENREQLYKALNTMHGESKRINKLVEDLLLLARMDGAPQLRTKELELDEVIEEMRPHLVMLAGVREVEFSLSRGIRGLYDPDKIKQVVLNLFQNAVQHTDPQSGKISISLRPAGSRAELTVRDNGAGIPAEHLSHVFDRFYRSDPSRARKYGGSGLGLSITKSITEAHGGEIGVTSAPGEGTAFRVTLPCLQVLENKS